MIYLQCSQVSGNGVPGIAKNLTISAKQLEINGKITFCDIVISMLYHMIKACIARTTDTGNLIILVKSPKSLENLRTSILSGRLIIRKVLGFL